MIPPTSATPTWSTSSFGDRAQTLPMDLTALGEHMDACKGAQHRLFNLQCAGETLNRFVAARFVTTLVIATCVLGAAAALAA